MSGRNIYSKNSLLQFKKQEEIVIADEDYCLTIQYIRAIDFKSEPEIFMGILNSQIQRLLCKIGYKVTGNRGADMRSGVPSKQMVIHMGFKINFVRAANYQIFLRIDTFPRASQCEKSMLHCIEEFYWSQLDRQQQERRQALRREFKGRVILTNYGEKRYYQIEDIIFKTVTEYKIGKVPLFKYYLNKYGVRIYNMNQPLLKVRSKNECCLVPQLCLAPGIIKATDESKKKAIHELVNLTARQRKDKIEQFAMKLSEGLQSREGSFFSQLGLNIAIRKEESTMSPLKTKMLKIPCQKLPPPILCLGSGLTVPEGMENSFHLYSRPIYDSPHEIRCVIIHYSIANLKKLEQTFSYTTQKMKLSFSVVGKKCIDESKSNTIQKTIKSALKEYPLCNMMLIVIPYVMKSLHKKIKTLCFNKTVNGKQMLSQIVYESTINNKYYQKYLTKLLLQMSAKVQNVIWAPKSGLITQSPILMIGFDWKPVDSQSIVICVCSTTDSQLCRIYTKAAKCRQGDDDQKYQTLIACFLSCIAKFKEINKNSSIQMVAVSYQRNCASKQFTNRLLSKVLSEGHDEISFTFVSVTSKTNQRLFVLDEDEDEVCNPQIGTIIRDGVLGNCFYIFTQQYGNCSVSPIKCQILFSNSQMPRSTLEQLIFNQCYNYANWMGVARVPGILLYAEKCCRFWSQCWEMDPRDIQSEMESNLYYL